MMSFIAKRGLTNTINKSLRFTQGLRQFSNDNKEWSLHDEQQAKIAAYWAKEAGDNVD